MKLLIAASEPMEFHGLLARAAQVRRAPVAADWARLASLGGHELLVVANGAGTARAGAAVDSALRSFHPDALASFGLCGAVSPDLRPAQIVLATEVTSAAERFTTAPLQNPTPHQQGIVRTIDRIARTAEEKRAWYATGVIAVEMEAAAVAARARAASLPFYCIKAVSDLADETLANDLNAALRPDGHFDTIKILGSTLRHPLARAPELLRLWRRSVRAANCLGDFFADCRF